MEDEGDASPFRYHLELNPKQLKVTHTALRALRDDFGHDEAEIRGLVEEVLAKLPDEHAIRAIQLGREPRAPEEILAEPPDGEIQPAADEPGDEPPPTVA
ncbi:MAG: hypothetical protein ACR2G3_05925 [Solirubrobacterales bacterium]